MPTLTPRTAPPVAPELRQGTCHYGCRTQVRDVYLGSYGNPRTFRMCVAHSRGAAYCDNGCGHFVHRSYLTQVVGNSLVCDVCMSTTYRSCGGCEGYIHIDVMPTHTCRRQRPRSSGYRPEPLVMYGADSGDTAFYGIELEVGVPGHHTADIEDAGKGLLYVKSDCSVYCDPQSQRSPGVEIVSHPMTLGWFQSNYPMDLLAQLREWGNVNRTCGMHVHASRNQFKSREHLADCSYLWNSQAEAVRALARRINREYAEPMNPDRAAAFAMGATGRDCYAPRYSLLNLQNSATVEFRGFAATLQPERLQASVELVAATIKYTELTVGTAEAREWESFGGWLFTNAETYPALVAQWFDRQMPALIVGRFAANIVTNVREANAAANRNRTTTGRARQAHSPARVAAAARRARNSDGTFASTR